MAQAIMLVCDVCGKPEAMTVTIRVGARNLQKDYCPKHLAVLVKGARAPKRGRRPGSVTKAKATTTRKSSARRPAARKSSARKRSGASKRAAAKG